MMRKGLVLLVAMGSFWAGAVWSPGLTAQSAPDRVPVTPKRGQQISFSRPESAACEVERVADHWVLCKGGTWRNLTNGSGFNLNEIER